MSSITIDNCNNSSLPPLLLPAVVHHYERNADLDKLSFTKLKQDKSVSGLNVLSGAESWSKHSANYTTSGSTRLLTPPDSKVQSSTITANSSLDNLANLAYVVAATDCVNNKTSGSVRANGQQPPLMYKYLQKKRSCSDSVTENETLASPVEFKKKGRKLPRKNNIRMSANTSFSLNPGTNSATTSGNSSCSSSRPDSPLSRHQSVSNSPSSVEEEPTGLSDFKENQKLVHATGAKVITSSKCKRQRTGPSCDVCRSKKIKCDATVLVLSQDPSLLSNCQRTESLHCPLSIDSCDAEILAKIPLEIRTQLAENKDMSLVRHVDKLIAFSSCSSCLKKKDRHCNFSKGFTRNDIAVFSTLNKKLGKRNSLGDFTVQDYLNTGCSPDQ